MVSSAPRWSSGPCNMLRSSSASSSRPTRSISRDHSSVMASSCSSASRLPSSFSSSTRAVSAAQGSVQAFSELTSAISARAASASFQKFASAMRVSNCRMRSCLAATLKKPPQLFEPVGVLIEAFHQLCSHRSVHPGNDKGRPLRTALELNEVYPPSRAFASNRRTPRSTTQNTFCPRARMSFSASRKCVVPCASSAPTCSTYSCQLLRISSRNCCFSVPSCSPRSRRSG